MKKKVGIVVKRENKAIQKADEFQKWMESKDIQVIRKEGFEPVTDHFQFVPKNEVPRDLFCVFVLGGDGTFLSAVRWIGDREIPILGIKFGEVGFLAEATEDYIFAIAEQILDGHFNTCERMRLVTEVTRNGEIRAKETVLNDIVINKGALARLAQIKTYINDHYLTTYRADGLIVATPTGSTAYSLAAGGPIVHPEVPGIVMSPICPFTLTNRPLIIPDSSCVTIRLAEKIADIMITFDGQQGLGIEASDTIVIKRSRFPVKMIEMPGQEYFDVLKAKLRWSGGRA